MHLRFVRKSFYALVAFACAVLIVAGCAALPSGGGVAVRPPPMPKESVVRHKHPKCDHACYMAFKKAHDVALFMWALAQIPRIPYNYDMWMRVHNCEQGDTWHGHGHFGNGLPAGDNGLGYSLGAWRDAVRYAAARGVWIPYDANFATPDQQMQAAQASLDATHGGPDCL